MSNKTDKKKQAVKNESSGEWILIKAEEFQEKFGLANGAIHAYAGMKLWDRIFNYNRLFKQYLTQLNEIDIEMAKKEEEFNNKFQEELEDTEDQ